MNSSTRQEREELYEQLRVPEGQTAAEKFTPDNPLVPGRFSDGEGVSGDFINLGGSAQGF